MEYKYRFTLCTPCYNSSKFIHRVFNSIDNFTFHDFEFIIINDASKDNTHQLIEDYRKKAQFPIKYLNRDVNKGVIENIKWGLEQAEGEFFLAMGHDDEWIPETLSIYNDLLEKYDDDTICGIGALCKTQHGDLVDFPYPKDVFISDYWHAFYEKKRLRHEAPLLYKTSIFYEYLTKYPHCFNAMIGCNYKMIFTNSIVRTYYVNETPNRLTARSRKELSQEVFTESIDFVNIFQYYIKHVPIQRFRKLFRHPLYGCICGYNLSKILAPIEKTQNKIIVSVLYLPAKLLSMVIH